MLKVPPTPTWTIPSPYSYDEPGLKKWISAIKTNFLNDWLQLFNVLGAAVYSVTSLAIVMARNFIALGGSTSSDVAIKGSGGSLLARLGDDSGYAPFGSGPIGVYNTTPQVFFYDLGASTNEKLWDRYAYLGTYYERLIQDGWVSSTPFREVTRSGTTLLRNRSWRVSQHLPTSTDDTNLAPSNYDMYFYLQSNTSLRVRVKGSDGVVREGTITLT